MKSVTITLPWPPAALSSNARHSHWGPLARAKKKYRDACHWSVVEQQVPCPRFERMDVLLEFVPPDRRRYDRDNLIARCKAGLDGVARAWGIDDSAFVRVAGEIVEGVVPARGAACVRVTVSEHWRAPLIERGSDGMPERLRL